MIAADLLYRTRKFAGDLGKVTYDDSEVYAAIEDAIRILAETAAQNNLADFRKNTEIEPNSPLPDNFLKPSRVFNSNGKELFRVMYDTPSEGEYSIVGNTLNSGDTNTPLTLWYFYYIPEIMGDGAEVDLPKNMTVPIAKVATNILANGSDDNTVSLAQYFMRVSTGDK